VVKLAQENAARAGVVEWVEFRHGAVSGIEPPVGRGWVATNPPYGVRIRGGKDLRDLYAAFGNVLKARCAGWRVAMLCSDPRLIANTGLAFDEGVLLRNGGVRVRLVRATV
jgi:putative N6-adenine-specific DNA methylase